MADNKSQCVLDLEEGLRVLLVDGDPTGKHSFFVESALDPGGNVKTGLLMTRQPPEFLRDADPETLDRYACIIIQAVPRFDARAVENLYQFVSKGGGLAFFFGELMSEQDYQHYNDMLRRPPQSSSNAPLLPFALKGVAELSRTPEETTRILWQIVIPCLAGARCLATPHFSMFGSNDMSILINRCLPMQGTLWEQWEHKLPMDLVRLKFGSKC